MELLVYYKIRVLKMTMRISPTKKENNFKKHLESKLAMSLLSSSANRPVFKGLFLTFIVLTHMPK